MTKGNLDKCLRVVNALISEQMPERRGAAIPHLKKSVRTNGGDHVNKKTVVTRTSGETVTMQMDQLVPTWNPKGTH